MLALGGCSMPDFDSIRAPDTTTLFRPYSVTTFRDKPLAPITANDLVDPGGNCPGAPVAPAASDATLPDGTPATGGGITLLMTECEVVQRTGPAQHVDIGAGANGERVTAITFAGGPRPGVYHFVDGRLRTMERGPEPVQPTKPAKRTAKPKKQTAAR